MEKLKNKKGKRIVIISIIIFGLAFGGVGMTKYVNASQVKNELVLGNKFIEEGKYEEAILEFQKVIKIEPKNIEARVELAKAYIKISKLEEAERILKETIGINPKKVDPYLELAKLYISESNLVDALKILTDGYKATNDQSIKSMMEDLKSKITVDNVNKTITLGENYSLPNEVTIKINNIEMQFPVKWEKTTVDVSAAGIQTITGTLENTDKTVTLTLNVVAIASIEDITSTIKQNDRYSLPSKVTAKMTDNSIQEVEVIWDLSTVDTSKAGAYTYQGTVSGYSGKVKLTLNIESDLTDKEIINLIKTSYFFEIDKFSSIKDIDIDIDSAEFYDSIFRPFKDQSIGIEERLNEYRRYFSNRYVDKNIRKAYKVIDNKVCVAVLQGDFANTKFNSVVEKKYDNNGITAKISITNDVEGTVIITLIKEDGKWKIDGGDCYPTDLMQ